MCFVCVCVCVCALLCYCSDELYGFIYTQFGTAGQPAVSVHPIPPTVSPSIRQYIDLLCT